MAATFKKQQQKKKKAQMDGGSDSDSDSDADRNFALLSTRKETIEEEFGSQSEDEEKEEEEDDEDGLGEEEGEGEEEEEEEEEEGDEEEASNDEEEGESDDEEEDDEEEEDEEEEEEGGSHVIQTREDIKNELSTMSFEEVQALQNKVGTKVYNSVAFGSSSSDLNTDTKREKKKKRLNKNRPTEVSSKRKAPFLRQVVQVKKPTLRDPRFDDLSGEYKPEIFEQTYRFINDIKLKEKQTVQKNLKKKMSNKKKEELNFLLKRMDNQERARQSREQQRERELQFKREQRDRATQGDRPFFLKTAEKKKLQLAERFRVLQKSGKLENYLSKKRKRNAGKDRRRLPPRDTQD